MLKNGLWGAIALAVIIGGHGAQAQTPIPPSPTDFIMAASQSDQYEASGGARGFSTRPGSARSNICLWEMIQEHTPSRRRLEQSGHGLPIAAPLSAGCRATRRCC